MRRGGKTGGQRHRQKDRHDQSNIHYSQFCEHAEKPVLCYEELQVDILKRYPDPYLKGLAKTMK